MTATHISMAQAKAKFSAMIDGAAHRDEHYLIERHGHAVAAVVSVVELERLERASPSAVHPTGAMALVGLWHDVADEEIDALLAEVGAARQRTTARRVEPTT